MICDLIEAYMIIVIVVPFNLCYAGNKIEKNKRSTSSN